MRRTWAGAAIGRRLCRRARLRASSGSARGNPIVRVVIRAALLPALGAQATDADVVAEPRPISPVSPTPAHATWPLQLRLSCRACGAPIKYPFVNIDLLVCSPREWHTRNSRALLGQGDGTVSRGLRAPAAAAIPPVVIGAADKGGEADAVGPGAPVVVDEQRRIVQPEDVLPCACMRFVNVTMKCHTAAWPAWSLGDLYRA